MALTASLVSDGRRLLIAASGVVESADIVGVRDGLSAVPGFRPDTDQLLDLAEAEVSPLRLADLLALARLSRRGGEARQAFVIRADAALAGVVEAAVRTRRGTLAVFSSRRDAERWLDGRPGTQHSSKHVGR